MTDINTPAPVAIPNGPTPEQLAARVADAGGGAGGTPAPGGAPAAPVVSPAGPVVPGTAAPAAPVVAPNLKPAYNGPSIVDYLGSVGKPNDFQSRTQLAKENGIENYTGTQAENDLLLSKVRGTMAPQDTSTPHNVGGTTFQDQVQKILTSYGITPPDPNENPTTAFENTYKQIYTNLGLDTVKDHITTTIGQVDALDKRYADQIDELKNNPWISESSRNTRIADLQKKQQVEKAQLTNQLTLYEKLYNSGRQDAQYVATKALTVSHQNDQLHQTVIMKAIDQVEKEMSAKTSLAKAGKKTTTPTGSKITLDQAQKNGFPLSVVGMSQQEVAQSFSETKPPAWFVDKLNNEKSQNVIPSVVNDTWQTYRQKFLNSSSAGVTEKKANTPSANATKALSYFKGTYGNAISDADAQALADRVDLYVQGGKSYAKAVEQVVSEASQ